LLHSGHVRSEEVDVRTAEIGDQRSVDVTTVVDRENVDIRLGVEIVEVNGDDL